MPFARRFAARLMPPDEPRAATPVVPSIAAFDSAADIAAVFAASLHATIAAIFRHEAFSDAAMSYARRFGLTPMLLDAAAASSCELCHHIDVIR